MHLLISTEPHPDYTIQWLTGIMPSSAVAVIDESKKVGSLWLDSRYESREITPRSGWTFTKHLRPRGWEFLDTTIAYTISSSCSVAIYRQLQQANYRIEVVSENRGSDQRQIKSSTELEQMQTCYQKTLQVLAMIQHQIDEGALIGKSCLQVRGECIAYAMSLGLTGEAFDMIVATGVQTASPHYETDGTLIQQGPLLIDMGRKRQGCCSDMTRCRRIGDTNHPDYSDWKTVYTCVQDAKDCGVRDAMPGMTGTQIDGLVRGVIEEGGYGAYFTHSTGHGIGLEVHEQPWVSSSQIGENVIQEGMCLTIEPGIYLPGRFGVRLEDTYYMRSTGVEIMDIVS